MTDTVPLPPLGASTSCPREASGATTRGVGRLDIPAKTPITIPLESHERRRPEASKCAAGVVCDLCGADDPEHLFLSPDGVGAYVRCTACGLIYGTAECEELAREYDAYYDHLLLPENLAKQRRRSRTRRWHLKALRRSARFEKFRQTGWYLEVGCAHGDFLKVVGDRGWKAIGVDISESAAQFARTVQGLDVRTGELERIAHQLPTGQFDVIWAANLLEHLVSPSTFLAEAARLLRPGGMLIASTLNADSWAFRLAGSQWQYTTSARLHRFVFSPATLRQFCAAHGFDIIRMKTTGFRFVSKYAQRRWFSPLVRLAEQGTSILAKCVNRGHRIEITASLSAIPAKST